MPTGRHVLSAVYFALKAITDPTGPTNGGCFRPIELHLPEGTSVNPEPRRLSMAAPSR